MVLTTGSGVSQNLRPQQAEAVLFSQQQTVFSTHKIFTHTIDKRVAWATKNTCYNYNRPSGLQNGWQLCFLGPHKHTSTITKLIKGPRKAAFVCKRTLKIDPIMKVLCLTWPLNLIKCHCHESKYVYEGRNPCRSGQISSACCNLEIRTRSMT